MAKAEINILPETQARPLVGCACCGGTTHGRAELIEDVSDDDCKKWDKEMYGNRAVGLCEPCAKSHSKEQLLSMIWGV